MTLRLQEQPLRRLSRRRRLDWQLKRCKLGLVKAAEFVFNGGKSDVADFAGLIKSATKELAEIRKSNRTSDLEIRRLQAATRKRLGRIRENLRHVEAAR